MQRRGRRIVVRLVASTWLVLGTVRCTLLNPLDHLQSGRDEIGPSTTDAAPVGSPDARGGGTNDTGGDGAEDVPCGVSHWTECGAAVVATPQAPGGVAIALNGDFYFTDEATGEIWLTSCSNDGCKPPTVRISGEVAPSDLAFMSDSLYWTTTTAVRRAAVYTSDASTPVATSIDTLSGPARITARYPHALWSDSVGIRGRNLLGNPVTYQNKPGHSLALSSGAAYFVSDQKVQHADFDSSGNPGAPVAYPASSGATAVTWAPVFPIGPITYAGAVGAVEDGSGSRLVLLDALDDAGAPRLLSAEPSAVVSLRYGAAGDSLVYWTTAAGELRRLAPNTAPVTLLRGLSSDTRIDATDNVVVIADRGAKRVIRYVR